MFKVITNKDEFIMNPVLEMNEGELKSAKTDSIVLYGEKYKMYADEWKHHVHIKCSDVCDANCEFCIEKSERNNPQNSQHMFDSVKEVLSDLAMQGHLKTVSITGGEPTMFPMIAKLVTLVNSYKLKLFSINTNGRSLDCIPKDFCGWVDISKHAIDDRLVFNRAYHLTPELVCRFKERHPNANVRFQCVLGVSKQMKSIGDILNYISTYKDVVDDFSFRNLIIEDNDEKVDELLFRFRKFLFEEGEFVE